MLLGCLALSACFELELSTLSGKPEPNIDIVFPKQDAISVSDNIHIRVTAKQGVSAIKINGINANTVSYLSRKFWQAEVPLQLGSNDINVSYQFTDKQHQETLRKVTRQPIYIPGVNFVTHNPADDSVIVLDGRSNALYRIAEDDSVTLIKQFYVSDAPSDDEDADEPHEREPETMAVSADGLTLYYTTEINDDDYIYALNIGNGNQTVLYGPTSPAYTRFDILNDEGLLLLPHEGVSGSLILTQVRDQPLRFDLNTRTIHTINTPAINSISGKSSAYSATFSLNDGELLMLGRVTSNPAFLFTFTLDLRACDSQPAGCELAISNYQFNPTLNDGCDNPERISETFYLHANKQYVIYDDHPKPCYLDVANNSVHSLYQHLGDKSEFDYGSLHFAGKYLLVQEESRQHSRFRRYTLADDFAAGTTDFTYVGADLTIGDAAVNVQTGREVVIDDVNNRLFYLERNNTAVDKAEVYVLDFATSSWSLLGRYPAGGFEIAVLNNANNTLYVYNDKSSNDDELFAIDLNNGYSRPVVSAIEKATVNYPLFNVDSIALNEEDQLIYLARRVDSSQLPAGYGRFSLLAFDIRTGELSEVSEVNNIPEQVDMYASYDMAYDSLNRRVLFYHSTSNDAIWAVDVDTGERSVFTDELNFYGPDVSNARGHVMDAENNRLLVTSQDSQSLFAVDLDSGVRTMLSPASFENDVFFKQIIGVDLFEKDASAFVADEGLDGIYQVDLITADRVIIHNPL